LRYDPVDIILSRVMPVIPKVIGDIQGQEKTAGNTQGKSEDINKGICLMPEQVPEGNGQVVAQHTDLHG